VRSAGVRRGVAVLAAAAALLAACGDDEADTAETGGAPTTTSTSTSTTVAPTSTSTSEPAGTAQPAIWPAADVVFEDPVEAADDFLQQVVGAGEAGEFRQGDSRSGEVDVLFRGEGGGQEIVRSTLLLRQLGPDDGWFVLAAVNPNASLSTPASGAEVPAGPLAVEGVGRGFEATVVLTARVVGAPDDLDEVVTAGGSAEAAEPFAESLDLSGAAPGDVVMLLVRGGTGLETDPGDFGAIPVVIAP
jgi:hypothetical protein